MWMSVSMTGHVKPNQPRTMDVKSYDEYLQYLERIFELQHYDYRSDAEEEELSNLLTICNEYERTAYGQ